MASVPVEPEPAADFRRELITINLRRIPWLLAASMLLSLWTIASLWHDEPWAWLRRLLMVDLASAGLLLALNARLRRLPVTSPWPTLYVWATVFLALAYMDGYYFLVGRSVGQSPVYILGVITAATVFLLPPRQFLPLLIVNHLAYCAILRITVGDADFFPMLIENTTGATVAGLVSILLYRARREEYLRRRALAAANRILEKRNDQLNDLMAITAHDLRSPLLGMRDLLVLAGRTRPQGRLGEMLERLTATCSDLIALVSRLLDAHAAEEQAEKPLALQRCDVRDLLTAAVERARLRADPREIAVTLELPSHPVHLTVNPPALGQVLDNLLSNAVKFSPSGGAPILVRLARDGQGWRCDIADAGPGIPAEERATLFQKFHRGANVAATGEQGSGLGLFIAATLMQAMGGQLHYQALDALRIAVPDRLRRRYCFNVF